MSRRRPRRRVTPKELKYYREHFREAIRQDGVVCLECGGLYKDLTPHLHLAHALATDDYREKWGYNRETGLITPALSEVRRQHAFAIKLPSLGPPDAIRKAIAAIPRRRPPVRMETRLAIKEEMRKRVAAGWRPSIRKKVEDDTLRALVAEGLTFRQIASRSGLSYNGVRDRIRDLGLTGPRIPPPFQLKATDGELLALRKQGLWRTEIAARTGMTPGAVYRRLYLLRRRGVIVPTSSRPRPNAMRKASDLAVLVGIRSGLGPSRLAPRLGLTLSGLEKRLARLRRRGLLRPAKPRPRIPDAKLLTLWEAGLSIREIATRIGFPPKSVGGRLWTLRKRGVSVPSPAERASRGRVSDEAILVQARMGLPPDKIAARVGLRPSVIKRRLAALRRRGALPPASSPPVRPVPREGPVPPRVSDAEILKLGRAGLWPHQIALRTGLTRRAVGWCLQKLRRQGVTVPRPPGRPPWWRRPRVDDERLLELARKGLPNREIAARLGLARVTVWKRLDTVRKRGQLPPLRHTRDRVGAILAHRKAGLTNREIAARLDLTASVVNHHLVRLRKQGVGVPPLHKSGASDEELIALAQARVRTGEIAARVGVSRSAVERRLARLRRQGRLNVASLRPPPRFSNEDLLDLVRAGLRTGQIAQRFRVAPSAVQARLRRLRQRGLLPPLPPQRRFSDEDLLTLLQAGLRDQDMARKLGVGLNAVKKRLQRLRRRGLIPSQPRRLRRFTDDELLAALRAGLRTGEIAHRFGVTRSAVEFRVRSLRRRGVPLPARPQPAPPNRRVTDEELVAFVREGLSSREIASRLRMRASHVRTRLAAVRRRGLLPPARPSILTRPAREERDRQILALHADGLLPGQIAARLGVTGDVVRTFLYRVRRRGLLPPALPRGGAHPPASQTS